MKTRKISSNKNPQFKTRENTLDQQIKQEGYHTIK